MIDDEGRARQFQTSNLSLQLVRDNLPDGFFWNVTPSSSNRSQAL